MDTLYVFGRFISELIRFLYSFNESCIFLNYFYLSTLNCGFFTFCLSYFFIAFIVLISAQSHVAVRLSQDFEFNHLQSNDFMEPLVLVMIERVFWFFRPSQAVWADFIFWRLLWTQGWSGQVDFVTTASHIFFEIIDRYKASHLNLNHLLVICGDVLIAASTKESRIAEYYNVMNEIVIKYGVFNNGQSSS